MATVEPDKPEPAARIYQGKKQADHHDDPERANISPALARRCLWVAAVAAVLTLPVAYTYDRYRLPDGFFARKYAQPSKYDVVFVGDSRVLRGIDPKVAAKGYRAFNFGFQALGLEKRALDHAKTLIDPSSKVKTLVIAVSRPGLSTKNQEENAFLEVERANPLERWNLAKFASVEPFLYPNPAVFMKEKGKQVSKIHADGFVFTNRSRPSEGMTKHDKQESKDQGTWANDEVLEKFAAWVSQATKEGYRIVSFRMPTSEGMYNLETKNLALDVAKVKQRLEAAGATWIDAPPYREDLNSYDGSHLDGKSAERFSAELATALSRTLPRP